MRLTRSAEALRNTMLIGAVEAASERNHPLMSECTHDCSSCAQNCSERTEENDFRAKLNNYSSVKKVIAVLSGKGGVGKSLVTSLLAVNAMRNGDHVAILDADITGPSIPNAFGVHEKAAGSDIGISSKQAKISAEASA